MKFHLPSVAIGAAGVLIARATHHRARPVFVEIAALSVHVARMSRAAFERKCEDLEDLWAEIEDCMNARARAGARSEAPRADTRQNAAESAPSKVH